VRGSGGGGGRSRKDSRRQRVAASWRTAGPFNVGSMRFVSMPFQPRLYAPRSQMCRSYSLQRHLQFTALTYRISIAVMRSAKGAERGHVMPSCL
jgi:hypothetical protein